MSNDEQLKLNETHENVDSILPDEVTEVLKEVPPERRREIERIMVSQMSVMSKISPQSEVSKKITSDHITSMIQTQHLAMEKTFHENHEKRWFSIGAMVLICGLLIGVIVLLKDQPEQMEKVLSVGITAVVSLAGGYGFGYHQGSKND